MVPNQEQYTTCQKKIIIHVMAVKESNTNQSSQQQQQQQQEACDPCKSFGQKCSHLVKKQRAKFYILRRCIAMLLCWHERGEH